MAAVSANLGALRLSGSPRRLTLTSAALADAESGELAVPESLADFAGGRTVAVPIRRKRGDVRVKLRLAANTPPGSYAAQLRVGDKSLPVTIDVAPSQRLRIHPSSADFVGDAKATADVVLTLHNRGNVPIEVPERLTVGMYDDEGLETAFADTYRQDTDDPLKLLGNWIIKLREGYGGLMRIRVTEGAGAVPPGAERRLTLQATFQDGLRAGHTYHGVWVLGPVNFRVHAAIRKPGSGA
jgi:hypothetical protein